MYRVLAALVSDYLSIISLPLISVFWGVVADTGATTHHHISDTHSVGVQTYTNIYPIYRFPIISRAWAENPGKRAPAKGGVECR